MKKAKIMLSAITVLAIAGGALAFTAKKNSTFLYTVAGTNNTCGGAQRTYLTVLDGGTQIQASTQFGGTCTTFSTVQTGE